MLPQQSLPKTQRQRWRQKRWWRGCPGKTWRRRQEPSLRGEFLFEQIKSKSDRKRWQVNAEEGNGPIMWLSFFTQNSWSWGKKVIIIQASPNGPITTTIITAQANCATGWPSYVQPPSSGVDPISAVPEKQCSHFISKQSGNEWSWGCRARVTTEQLHNEQWGVEGIFMWQRGSDRPAVWKLYIKKLLTPNVLVTNPYWFICLVALSSSVLCSVLKSFW